MVPTNSYNKCLERNILFAFSLSTDSIRIIANATVSYVMYTSISSNFSLHRLLFNDFLNIDLATKKIFFLHFYVQQIHLDMAGVLITADISGQFA